MNEALFLEKGINAQSQDISNLENGQEKIHVSPYAL